MDLPTRQGRATIGNAPYFRSITTFLSLARTVLWRRRKKPSGTKVGKYCRRSRLSSGTIAVINRFR